MEHMGYGEQPYVVIRHHDTKHEHVHIVSSTIKEDCLQINLSNDIRRSIATQKHLETVADGQKAVGKTTTDQLQTF